MGVIIILVITVVLIGVTVRFYQEETAERTQVLILSLTVSDGEEDPQFDRWDPDSNTHLPYIANISADASVEQGEMSILDAPKEDAPIASDFPIIWIYKVIDEEGNRVGYRNSIEYTDPGTYELTLALKDDPEPGDKFNIYFKIVDQRVVQDEEGNYDITEFQMFPYFSNNLDIHNSIVRYVWE